MELQGRTVLVTGAARGIGAAVAREAGRRGAGVALVGIEPERMAELSRTLPGSKWFEADVTDRDAVDEAVAAAAEHFGGLDVVMANAGVSHMGTVESLAAEDFERVVEVNLLGVYRTVRAALPHLFERRGYALCVASLAAPIHAPFMASYSASKAGVEGFANSLRIELRQAGVDVGVAYFGYIDTDMVRGSMGHAEAAGLRRQSIGPIRRDHPPEDAARAVVDGMERRARIVAFPRWVRPLLAARGLLQPLVEAQLRRAGVGEAVRRANERARGEAEPVVRGGARHLRRDVPRSRR